jgi:hypothetical protein
MENKMTAVEWLVQQLTEVDYNCINKTFLQNNQTLSGIRMRKIFSQALQMEKEQIIDACKKGYGSTAIYRNKLSEQYYAEKYGKTFIDLVSDEESKVHEVVRKLKENKIQGGNKLKAAGYADETVNEHIKGEYDE